jgi:hypothetical protein
LRLNSEYCTARDGTGSATTSKDDILTNTRFILVGASHATWRLAAALKELGAEVADLSVPRWRLTEAAVEDSVALLRDVIDECWEGETVVMYQLFDNTSFYSIGTDGTAALPRRSPVDGKYHIPGALGMVDRDSFKKEFGTAVPLLRAGGLHKKVLISPLIRYAVSNCCDNEDHCTNRGTGLNTMMATGLANLETWLDDQAYLKRIRNFVVINPNNFFTSDTDGVTKSDTKAFKLLWRDGPVHMVDAGYQKLAKNILEALPEVTFSRSYSNEEKPATSGSSQQARPPRGRGRGCVDWAARRQSWVTSSDTVAHRTAPHGSEAGSSNSRGRGTGGRRPWRAGGQWRGDTHRGRYKKKYNYKPY